MNGSIFREISRAAEGQGKVIVTAGSIPLKDIEEQKEIIEDAFHAAGTASYSNDGTLLAV